jgi:manganese/zinc/iron transport system permease protein
MFQPGFRMLLHEFMVDPIVRGPLFACALLGALTGIMGAFVVFARQSLVGETISHSCYPGMVIGALLADSLFDANDDMATLFIIFFGAVLSALFFAWCTSFLVKQRFTSHDSALSAVLAASFSVGLLFVSAAQTTFPSIWRRLQSLLVGQAATMTDEYVLVATLLAVLVFFAIAAFSRSLKTMLFDSTFARLHGLSNGWIEQLFSFLLVITVITTIRSVGVVLMSALLIFPAVSARFLTRQFRSALLISALIGSFCSVSGVILSHAFSVTVQDVGGKALWLPTGPLIALCLTFFFVLSFLFSPHAGLVFRLVRAHRFEKRCRQENMLKVLWKSCYGQGRCFISLRQLAERMQLSKKQLLKMLTLLKRSGYIHLHASDVEITASGMLMGRKLVRLHRLWELYLVEYCGIKKDRVHPSAEEMEHILTPAVEKELTVLLNNPLFDPHAQPIPSAEGDLCLHE